MIELLLFASTFVTVFALGLQSLNVNGGHYVAAFFTSFVIGTGNLFVLKLVPGAGLTEIAAYLAGGPFGIMASMWMHRRTIGRKKHRQAVYPVGQNPPPPEARHRPAAPPGPPQIGKHKRRA